MSRYSIRTTRWVRELASEQSKRFDSTLVSNAVYDTIRQDELLHRIIGVERELDDLQSEMYDLESAEQSELHEALRQASYGFRRDSDPVELRVAETVDAALEDIAASLDDWDDLDDEDRRAATREIREFWDDAEEVDA